VASSISLRVAEYLGKELIPWEIISGILHITLLHESSSSEYLQNILTQSANAPKNPFDFLLLNTARARSSIVIASGATLRCEGGNPIKLYEPFVDSLIKWRKGQLGLSLNGTVFIISKSGTLLPSWPIFTTKDALFSPVIITHDNVIDQTRKLFEKGTVRIPVESMSSFSIDQEFESFLKSIKYFLLNSKTDKGEMLYPLPHCIDPEIPHVITIESGPTTTRPLYETADGTSRIKDCPIDWLLLTRFSGFISQDSLGENVLKKSTIEVLFDLVVSSKSVKKITEDTNIGGAGATSTEEMIDNDWIFELWKRKSII
jgi:hypothetical protein